jgi:D-glycero-alpha-D-manno-heptose 1-phosphate guanylyltransferase
MEAIILAGGLGTRLSHILADVPKPMADVNGEPFLTYIFEYVLKNRIEHVVLAVGYKAEFIKDYFKDEYKGIKITYSFEDIPLGTGGAIKKALNCCKSSDVFILNGDTYFDVDLNEMKVFHEKNQSKLTVAVKELSNFDRYGSVVIENDMIKRFVEKKPTDQGKINGGIYRLQKEVLNSVNKELFSFEKVILESGIVDIYAFRSDRYFIDIGVPEDYYKAQGDFLNFELDVKRRL